MITNQRQQRITKNQITHFEAAISRAEQDGPGADVDPRLHDAMIDGMRSQVADLQDESNEYDALREGKVRKRVFHSILEIPLALIEGRIVRRLTQKQLGDKLGVPEQQIQRYEQTRYSGVGVERLQEIADVLEIKVKKTVEYDVPRALTRRGSVRTRTVSKAGRGNRLSVVTTSKGSAKMPSSKKTGKAAASAAGKTLSSKGSSSAAKKAAASDLAQVGNPKVTGKAAASAAGTTLASKSAPKRAKKAAASDLSQAAKKKQ